jgi:hypothetical protein
MRLRLWRPHPEQMLNAFVQLRLAKALFVQESLAKALGSKEKTVADLTADDNPKLISKVVGKALAGNALAGKAVVGKAVAGKAVAGKAADTVAAVVHAAQGEATAAVSGMVALPEAAPSRKRGSVPEVDAAGPPKKARTPAWVASAERKATRIAGQSSGTKPDGSSCLNRHHGTGLTKMFEHIVAVMLYKLLLIQTFNV